eukprot:1661837-Amphidinium_carterae.1
MPWRTAWRTAWRTTCSQHHDLVMQPLGLNGGVLFEVGSVATGKAQAASSCRVNIKIVTFMTS